MTKICPIDSSHLVRAVFISNNLNYEFCTACREDTEVLFHQKYKKDRKGQIFHFDRSQCGLDLFDSEFSNWNYLLTGESRSGKTSLMKTILENYYQKKPNSRTKTIIFDATGEYSLFVQGNGGIVINAHDSKFATYISFQQTIHSKKLISINFNNRTDVLSYSTFCNYLESYLIDEDSSLPKIFVFDSEILTKDSNCFDYIKTMLWSSYSSKIANFLITEHPNSTKLQTIFSEFESLFFCGHKDEVSSFLAREYKFNFHQTQNLKSAGFVSSVRSDQQNPIIHLEFFYHSKPKSHSLIHKLV